MPSYAFTWSDVEGSFFVELPDREAAWSEAVRSIAGVLRDAAGAMKADGELMIQVHDEGGFVGSVRVSANRARASFTH